MLLGLTVPDNVPLWLAVLLAVMSVVVALRVARMKAEANEQAEQRAIDRRRQLAERRIRIQADIASQITETWAAWARPPAAL